MPTNTDSEVRDLPCGSLPVVLRIWLGNNMKAIYQERMSENMEQRMRLRILLLLDGRPHGDMLTLEDAWASMRKNIRNHFGRNDDEWVNPHMSLNDYEQLFRRVWLEVQQELAAF